MGPPKPSRALYQAGRRLYQNGLVKFHDPSNVQFKGASIGRAHLIPSAKCVLFLRLFFCGCLFVQSERFPTKKRGYYWTATFVDGHSTCCCGAWACFTQQNSSTVDPTDPVGSKSEQGSRTGLTIVPFGSRHPPRIALRGVGPLYWRPSTEGRPQTPIQFRCSAIATERGGKVADHY
jgi:hypothetical protein